MNCTIRAAKANALTSLSVTFRSQNIKLSEAFHVYTFPSVKLMRPKRQPKIYEIYKISWAGDLDATF